jgi:lipopolysaccharide/colanic/teichoic acid biosynthesis glycosyltransferase
MSTRNGSSSELRDLLPEPMFLRALCLERKRAERSRRLFVLMLLDQGEPSRNGSGVRVLDQTLSAVLSSIRETDIAGWQTQDAALGVIFVELGAGAKEPILRALRARVTAALRSGLAPEDLDHVRISFHCFPEDPEDRETGPPTMAELYPDLVQRDAGRTVARVVKRAMDVAGSSMALIVLAPIFLATAVAVKLSSPGPILFRQKRIGRNGVPFTCLKFRSMYAVNDSHSHRDYIQRFIAGNVNGEACEAHGNVVYKITEDPRVTRVGRFLRKTSVDELPQFLNVLRGEMSLVGPRPPIRYELEAYDIWHRRRLLEVRPGITGLWQVSGRSRLRFDDMVRLDLSYAKAWSLSMDLKILLRTPRAVLSGDGAY